nr:uncharacterized protein LOC111503216 [Leptinotarsa decemlineata]
METENGLSATKRCSNIQEEFGNCSYTYHFREKFETTPQQNSSFVNRNAYYSQISNSRDEEPVDLTFPSRDIDENAGAEAFNNFFPKLDVPVTFPHGNTCRNNIIPTRKNFVPNLEAQPFQIVNCSEGVFVDQKTDYYPKRKRKRRKFIYTTEGKLILVTEDPSQIPTSFSPAKQLEILKAAKSLFSKRTRTLYHWMYPNAAKQQIKSAVTTSWESLAETEKEFYISQVLGRFGFPQTNLMINPQLGSIRKLPPLPPPPIEKVEKPKLRELETAISSITPITNRPVSTSTPISFEEFEKINEKSRKKRGRPKAFNVNSAKRSKMSSVEFQDDPELSQELEKFAMKFKLNKY